MLTAQSAADLARRNIFSIQFPADGKIVIALSGGSDSTALLTLAHDVLSTREDGGRLLAVTVDHGLRPESADEARRAGALCASLGISHVTRRWEGKKPKSGLQAAAREARYWLLAEEAEGATVLTGHTLNDQLETVAMRQARGPGRGLSGIAPATLYEGRTWFVRPLIARRRAELREYLSAAGFSWIDDPSNSDLRFERVRVRESAGTGEVDDADIRAAFATRCAESEEAAQLLRDEAAWRFDSAAGTAEYDPGEAEGRAGAGLALAAVMSRVGQQSNLAPQGLIDKVLAFCAEAGSGKRMTASGCLLAKSAGRVVIGREARNRRDAGYGYDHLLPSPDFAVAQALAERTAGRIYPALPISGYPE